MKYIVMECHIGYAVVLDEDGRFLKVANRNYQVGQTVTDVIEMSGSADSVTDVAEMEEMSSKARTGRKARSWMYSVAAMAACLVLVMVSVFTMDQKIYASVFLFITYPHFSSAQTSLLPFSSIYPPHSGHFSEDGFCQDMKSQSGLDSQP